MEDDFEEKLFSDFFREHLRHIAHIELTDGVLSIIKDLNDGMYLFLYKKNKSETIDDMWYNNLFEGIDDYVNMLDEKDGELIWEWYGSGQVEENDEPVGK